MFRRLLDVIAIIFAMIAGLFLVGATITATNIDAVIDPIIGVILALMAAGVSLAIFYIARGKTPWSLFKFLKIRQYEKNVEACIRALLADISTNSSNPSMFKGIKTRYAENWGDIIKENFELKNSPELTALIVSVIFLQDMLYNDITYEQKEEIQKCIIDKIYDDDIRPHILFIMEFLVMLSHSWIKKEIKEDHYFLAIRDLHRAIFEGDDAHLDETEQYLVDGANRLKSRIRPKAA